MNSGVYVIEHRESGKKYVGSAAKSFKSRWGQHRHKLRKGTHRNAHLQSAWNKYGEEAFVFRILKRTLPGEAVEHEQVFIDLFQATDPKHGYNNAPIAGSNLGYKHTDEAKANMSAAKMGKKTSAETRAKMSAAHMGRTHTAESVAKMTGKKFSAEHCAKLSAAALGRKLSAEHCAKMSAAMKLRPLASAETRAKISAAGMGNKHNLGRKASAETRAKMSASHMDRKARVTA